MRINCIAPLLLAALQLSPALCGAQQHGARTGTYSDGPKIEHVWLDDGKGIEVRASGELDLREDASDVESISPRGYLIVQQRVGSATHRAEWHAAAGGGVTRSYTVDGQRLDFAEARPWLDHFFPEVLRKTSIDVRARFRRVLAQRGVSGVLEEAGAAGSGRTRELFLEGLAERDLTPSEAQRFIQVLGGVSSSSTRRELLLKRAGRQSLTIDQWTSWFAAASAVTSGSDRRELLIRAVSTYPRGRALPDGFFDVLHGMSSSSDRREVLLALLAERGSEPGMVAAVVASAAELPSSSDRHEVLKTAAQFPIAAATLTLYLHVVEGSSTSSDRREALTALLLNRASLQTSPEAVAWLRAVRQVTSESHRAALLMAAVGALPPEQPVRAAFAETIETLSSDTSYNQVATAYLRSQVERR